MLVPSSQVKKVFKDEKVMKCMKYLFQVHLDEDWILSEWVSEKIGREELQIVKINHSFSFVVKYIEGEIEARECLAYLYFVSFLKDETSPHFRGNGLVKNEKKKKDDSQRDLGKLFSITHFLSVLLNNFS